MHWLEPGWAVLISVIVGALIGGVTNLLAIVMIFRPHRAWKIGAWTVPMTPGLIPKRQGELARQLGKVVEEHLLSVESVSGFMEDSLEPGWVRRFLMERLERMRQSEQTVRQWLAEIGLPESLRNRGDGGTNRSAVDFLLNLFQPCTDAVAHKTLAQWLGPEGVMEIRARIPSLAHWLWSFIYDSLGKEDGRRQVYWYVQDFLRSSLRGGTMWHAVASLFVDEVRVAGWIYRRLMDWMARPQTEEQLAQWLERQWDVYAYKPLGEWLDGLEEERKLLEKIVGQLASRSLDELLDKPLKDLLSPLNDEEYRENLAEKMEKLEDELIRLLPNVLRRLPVAQIVERQVLSYPIPQLEKLIVEVASRELKMITFLGAVIGGLVGLVQGFWFLFILG